MFYEYMGMASAPGIPAERKQSLLEKALETLKDMKEYAKKLNADGRKKWDKIIKDAEKWLQDI